MKRKSRIMLKIQVILCVLTITQLLPSVITAETYNTDMTFNTSGESMWVAGPAYQLDYNKFFGFDWNKSGGFNAIWRPELFGESLGNYGLAVQGSTSGKIGIDVGLKINGGSVNVTYPVAVALDYTSPIIPGGTFNINSFYMPQSWASMNTFFPTLTPKANAVVEIAANLNATGCIVDCIGGNIFNLAPEPFNKNLLDFFGAYIPIYPGDSKTYSLPSNWGWIGVTIPGDLNTTGVLSGNNLLSKTGESAGEFLDAELNLLKLGELIPGHVGAAFKTFNELEENSKSFSFLGTSASIAWNVIDIGAGIIARLEQAFQFIPDLKVDLLTEDGLEFASFDVGDSVTLTVPQWVTSPDLKLFPVFTLDNSFTNNTDLGVDPAFSLSVLSGSATAHIPLPWPLDDVNLNKNFGPLYENQWIANGLDFGIYSNTFSLNFDPIYGEAFTVHVASEVPEPATLLLLGSGLIGLAAYGRKKFFKN